MTRTITTYEELRALPVESVVLDHYERGWQRSRGGWICVDRKVGRMFMPTDLGSVTVLHDPSAPTITADCRDCAQLINERDSLERTADRLASAIAPESVLGEHSSGNDPWENALDYAKRRPTITDDVDGLFRPFIAHRNGCAKRHTKREPCSAITTDMIERGAKSLAEEDHKDDYAGACWEDLDEWQRNAARAATRRVLEAALRVLP